MRRALDGLTVRPELALVDGNRAADFGLPVQTIVGGDGKSANIAAASILAKVTRDRYMIEQDACYPEYGFAVHKGYGTRRHYDALREFGPVPDSPPELFEKILCRPLIGCSAAGGEAAAAEYLRQRGLSDYRQWLPLPLRRNRPDRQKKKMVIFCEVKTRRSAAFAPARAM